MCQKCGKQIEKGKYYCRECQDKLNKNTREERAFLKSIGICPRCRKNMIFEGENTCPECKAYNTNGATRLREKDRENYNEKQKVLHKKIYDQRKENGLCTRCGKRKADYGYFTCGVCRSKDRKRRRAKYGKPDRQERFNQGLCYFCDNPVKEGYKVCEYHYQKNVENARSYKANKAREDLVKSGILH